MSDHQIASTGEIVEDTVKKAMPTVVDGKPVIHVKVYSPFQTYFDDLAFSISGVNDTGPFDILPKHHNFLTLLAACDLVVQSTQGEHRIKIARGIMHVKADKVIVFLDV